MNKLYGYDTDQLRDKDFDVIRSDTGDGGWSIHWLHDKADDDGLLPMLVSGPASWGEHGWNRPNDEDYADAIEVLFRRNGK